MLASEHYGTLYIGVTSDLVGRLWQHRDGVIPGFTQTLPSPPSRAFRAFLSTCPPPSREKSGKRWRRQWKINLLERDNPHWDDLAVPLGYAAEREAEWMLKRVQHDELGM